MTRVSAPPEFTELTEPFRRELLAHCYRMLGSVHDAEDLVQETYLRAWRHFDGFAGRSSLRSWLYRIATNVCLTALQSRGRRALPSGLADPDQENQWLQPIPDTMVDDPAAIVTSRESLRLAMIASLQYLPPRQRAVLLLRDVLAWPAAEVAELLDTTVAAVKSTLQRARARLDQVSPDQVTQPEAPQAKALLDEYIAAFQNADAATLERLLREDAVLEMPPSAIWFSGGDAATTAVGALGRPGDWMMTPTMANGQPAAAAYRRVDGAYHAYGIVLLTTTPTHITKITAFADPDLFAVFNLPTRVELGR